MIADRLHADIKLDLITIMRSALAFLTAEDDEVNEVAP
jgi:hypothetical protein